MEKNISKLHSAQIVINATQYDVASDHRFLIPYMIYAGGRESEIRFGFINKDGNIVIPAKYDKICEDFNNEQDLVRVGMRFSIKYGTSEKSRYNYFHYGVIDSFGKELIPCDKYTELYFTLGKERLIAYYNGGCALIDIQGREIIPYGKYRKIYDFVHGFARVLDAKGWGITDTEGNSIIDGGEFEEIWDLKEQYSTIVVKRKSVRYVLPFEMLRKLQEELVTTGCISTPVEEYLNFKAYLQHDFTNGIPEVLQF